MEKLRTSAKREPDGAVTIEDVTKKTDVCQATIGRGIWTGSKRDTYSERGAYVKDGPCKMDELIRDGYDKVEGWCPLNMPEAEQLDGETCWASLLATKSPSENAIIYKGS